MPTAPVSSEKQAEIAALERAIHEALEAEIAELAATLATTDDAHAFGQVEFQVRSIALRIAAKAFEQHLARKKMDTTAPGRPAPTAAARPSSTRIVSAPRSASSAPSAIAAPPISAGPAAGGCSPSTAPPA